MCCRWTAACTSFWTAVLKASEREAMTSTSWPVGGAARPPGAIVRLRLIPASAPAVLACVSAPRIGVTWYRGNGLQKNPGPQLYRHEF